MLRLTVLVLFALLSTTLAKDHFVGYLTKPYGASDMTWVDNEGKFLESPNKKFVLQFFNLQTKGRYFLCITQDKDVVWIANREIGVSKEDMFMFQQDGNVVLFGSRGLPVWQTRTNGTDAQTIQLRDDGNLLVLDSTNSTLWQSFDHPTDTLLQGQQLRSGMQLVSITSSSDWSPGKYSLTMLDNTLQLLADLGSSPMQYWNISSDSRTIFLGNGQPSYAAVDASGNLQLFGSSNTQVLYLFSFGSGNVKNSSGFLVLGPDGSLKFKPGGGLSDLPLFTDECKLPMRCGPYGVCSSSNQCNCPVSLSLVNPLDNTQGCKVSNPPPLCKSPDEASQSSFQDLDPGLSYFGVSFGNSTSSPSLDSCKQLCSRTCSCNTGFFAPGSQSCYLSLTPKPGSFMHVPGNTLQSFIRVSDQQKSSKQKVSVFLIIGSSVLFIVCSIAIFTWWYRRRLFSSRGDPDEEDGFLDSIPGLPTRFTYKELHVATNGFTKKLGGGGFGSVYEGLLPDRSRVAVKQLESIGQGKKEFRAEVATIGSIHHVNLVRLRGFCSEGNHRLLVYEFLARGSLDKSLFIESSLKLATVESDSTPIPPLLEWDTRYNIALGTARGLAYLHEDCRERIIHCDIKPENILLDESFTAKVSDFGLAKLMNREQSHVFTTMRGTRGYLAPEWLLNTAISEKSDVYSFGMVLLEIVSGRKNFDPTEISEKWYIPAYAFKQAEVGKLTELLDPRLKGFASEEQVVQTVKIALWCIQEEMQLRPSTGKVVQMLEGIIPVPEPPLSTQLAVRLHARLADAVSERDRYSIGSEFNSEDLLSASYLSGPR